MTRHLWYASNTKLEHTPTIEVIRVRKDAPRWAGWFLLLITVGCVVRFLTMR